MRSSYQDQPAGFEYYCDSIEDYLDEVADDFDEAQLKRLQKFELAVDFVTHSRFHDGVAACIAAGTLTKLTAGLLLDCQTGKFHGPIEAVAWAKHSEASAQPHLSEDRA